MKLEQAERLSELLEEIFPMFVCKITPSIDGTYDLTIQKNKNTIEFSSWPSGGKMYYSISAENNEFRVGLFHQSEIE